MRLHHRLSAPFVCLCWHSHCSGLGLLAVLRPLLFSATFQLMVRQDRGFDPNLVDLFSCRFFKNDGDEFARRVQQLISELHRGNHIDDMTQRWLCQTPSTPRTPTFYTLTKIHKPLPVGRPIISGCEGPTERLSYLLTN